MKRIVLLPVVVVAVTGCSGAGAVPGDAMDAVPADDHADVDSPDEVPYCPTYCHWEPHYRQCGPGDCQPGFKCPPDGLVGCVPSSCQCILEGTECKMYCTADCSENLSRFCVPDPDCVPDCAGRVCGSDGCGGSCGKCVDCEGGAVACSDGQCSKTFCCPDCNGRECGDDGCGGSCGLCGNVAKPVCGEGSQCAPAACLLPVSWGKVGVVASLRTPASAEKEVVESICPDFTGDGKGENGFKSLAAAVNPALEAALEAGDVGIVLEFRGVEDFANAVAFTLVGLSGRPEVAGDTSFWIDPNSFRIDAPTSECEPRVAFDGATIGAGVLRAGPADLTLSIPVKSIGGIVTAHVEKTGLEATISDDGVNATGGVVAGLWPREDIAAVLARVEALCTAHPADICSYLGTAKAFLATLCGVDLDDTCVDDALPFCFQFTLKSGAVLGIGIK
jgi:hypothetical protein